MSGVSVYYSVYYNYFKIENNFYIPNFEKTCVNTPCNSPILHPISLLNIESVIKNIKYIDDSSKNTLDTCVLNNRYEGEECIGLPSVLSKKGVSIFTYEPTQQTQSLEAGNTIFSYMKNMNMN